jgi:hypothetical protein
MGRSSTPKYVIEVIEPRVRKDNSIAHVPVVMIWEYKRHGKPTDANVKKYVHIYAKSFEPGGVNSGISQEIGYIPYPSRAFVRLNRIGSPAIASFDVPNFYVW